MKSLLGKKSNHQTCLLYSESFFNVLTENTDRGTCNFKVNDQEYPVEELIAMQLAHIKRQAEKHGGGDKVYGAVITVQS